MADESSLGMALLLGCCLALTGCGTASTVSKSTNSSVPQGAWAEGKTLPTSDELLRIAENEWNFFGRQKVIVTAEEESIPHVGFWEDEDDAHSGRINQYWQAAGEPGLTGRDCDQAWSAAFMVWLMRTAGVPESVFPSAISHRVYLSKFLAETPNTLFMPRTLAEYRPKRGDLICAVRENSLAVDVKELPRPEDLEKAKLHCDIVVDTDGHTLQAIGGNVRNSVSRTYLSLSPDGLLQPTARRPWFLILENRMH